MKQIDSEKKIDRLKIDKLLKTIYSNNTTEEINFISNQLLQILDDFSEKSAYEEKRDKERWNESHSVLITYADSIYKNGEATLITLSDFLNLLHYLVCINQLFVKRTDNQHSMLIQ